MHFFRSSQFTHRSKTLTLVYVGRKSTHEDLPREPLPVVAAVDGAVVDAAAAARGRPPARPGAASAAGRSVELSRVAAKLWKIITLTKPIAENGTEDW